MQQQPDAEQAQRLRQLRLRSNLGYAAERCNEVFFVRRLKVLLAEQGADPNAVAQHHAGRAPLYLAAEAGHAQAVTALLRHGADVDWVCPGNGKAALQIATAKGHDVCLALLIEHGAALDALTAQGNSALTLAATYGHTACVKALVDANADTTIKAWPAAGFGRTDPHAEPASRRQLTALEIALHNQTVVERAGYSQPQSRWGRKYGSLGTAKSYRQVVHLLGP
jgi:ankyrin repeat protein